MKKISVSMYAYLFVIFVLFLYSYTQVDLDLTFSRVAILHTIIKAFQYIGYFQRPISTFIYILILIFLFFFYFLFLNKTKKNTFTQQHMWILIIGTAIVLLFSYNAFSYDLFNYIFDAKIFTFYHQNPYLHKALDYPHDPMLTFMRWTHRTYPYGPAWLFLTIPLSYLGLQLFIPTFLLFKALAIGSYVGSCYMIQKISNKLSKENTIQATLFFALNPLVIIECLISAHIDIVMVFLFLWSFHLFLNKKYVWTIIILLLSIGIKYATIFLVPVYLLIYYLHRIKQLKVHYLLLGFVLMIIAVIVEMTVQKNPFQSWYLLIVLPFSALLSEKKIIYYPSIIFSFFSLLIYIPFLYIGSYTRTVTAVMNWTVILGISICVIFIMVAGSVYFLGKRR